MRSPAARCGSPRSTPGSSTRPLARRAEELDRLLEILARDDPTRLAGHAQQQAKHVRALKQLGVKIGLSQVIDASRSAELVDIADKEDFRALLRSNLAILDSFLESLRAETLASV